MMVGPNPPRFQLLVMFKRAGLHHGVSLTNHPCLHAAVKRSPPHFSSAPSNWLRLLDGKWLSTTPWATPARQVKRNTKSLHSLSDASLAAAVVLYFEPTNTRHPSAGEYFQRPQLGRYSHFGPLLETQVLEIYLSRFLLTAKECAKVLVQRPSRKTSRS